jgi:MFS family permease
MSGFFVGFACGIFISGRLIRRMGHIRTFAFCAAVCASIALLHSLWVDPWAWMALRFLYGLSLVTLMTVTESWLNARAEKHERGRVFAMYMVVNLGGIALAQQLLRLSPGELLVLFSVSAILSCWALLPITISSRSQPHIPERAKSSLKKIIGFAPLAVATSALSGLAMGAFWAMAPLYASKLGFGLSEVGLLMSLTIVGGALLQIPIGRFHGHAGTARSGRCPGASARGFDYESGGPSGHACLHGRCSGLARHLCDLSGTPCFRAHRGRAGAF